MQQQPVRQQAQPQRQQQAPAMRQSAPAAPARENGSGSPNRR
jgi:hypothetical protein